MPLFEVKFPISEKLPSLDILGYTVCELTPVKHSLIIHSQNDLGWKALTNYPQSKLFQMESAH